MRPFADVLLVLRWMGVLLLCGQLHAQTNVTDPAPREAKESQPAPTQPSTSPTLDITTDLSTSLRDGRIVTTEEVESAIRPGSVDSDPFRPVDRPEYPKISPEVRQKLIEFQRIRERYLEEQQRLLKIYKGATEEERDKIRELIRAKRERWIDQSRRIRRDARERTIEMMRELPKHQKVFEAVRDKREDIRRDGLD